MFEVARRYGSKAVKKCAKNGRKKSADRSWVNEGEDAAGRDPLVLPVRKKSMCGG